MNNKHTDHHYIDFFFLSLLNTSGLTMDSQTNLKNVKSIKL